MRTRLLFLACLAAAVSPAAELRGRVLDVQDGRSLPGASIQLNPEKSVGESYKARSGADGTFSIADLEPGVYRAVSAKPGYEGSSAQIETVTITAANERKSLTVRMRRSGVIAGRVLDAWGDPAPQVNVRLLHWRSAGGVRHLQPVQIKQADDLGGYRFFDLMPGRYFVLATPRPTAAGAGDALFEEEPRYWPGVASPAEASAIALDWGSSFEQADIELTAAQDTLLMGSVALANGSPCAQCRVSLESSETGFHTSVQPNETGGFRLLGLPPGPYRALVHTYGDGVAYEEFVQPRDRPGEVLVRVSEGTAIRGKTLREKPSDDVKQAGRGAAVMLSRVPPLIGERYESPIRTDPDEEFEIKPVPPGEYAVTALVAPEDGYAAEILADGAPLDGWRLRVDPGRAEIGLVVRVATDGGRISGSAAKPEELADRDVMVVLLPADFGGRQGVERYSGLRSPDGGFEIKGAPPGVHGLGVVRRMPEHDWSDPDLRARFLAKAKTVRVSPRSSQQIEAPFVELVR